MGLLINILHLIVKILLILNTLFWLSVIVNYFIRANNYLLLTFLLKNSFFILICFPCMLVPLYVYFYITNKFGSRAIRYGNRRLLLRCKYLFNFKYYSKFLENIVYRVYNAKLTNFVDSTSIYLVQKKGIYLVFFVVFLMIGFGGIQLVMTPSLIILGFLICGISLLLIFYTGKEMLSPSIVLTQDALYLYVRAKKIKFYYKDIYSITINLLCLIVL